MTVLAKIVTQRDPDSTTVPLAALRFRPRNVNWPPDRTKMS